MNVLNLGRSIAGGYAGSMLALAGAAVTRVDLQHPALAAVEGDELTRAYIGRGQQATGCDLATPAGVDELRELVAGTDAVIEDLGPGGLDAIGFAEEVLRAVNPNLVIVRLSDFGLDGPQAGWAGSELVNLAAGGLLFLTGTWEKPPVQTAPLAVQFIAGLLAANATLAALYGGEAVTLDLSKQEDVLTMVNPAVSEYGYLGTIQARDGRASAMARIERSKDGWVYAGPGAAASADYQAYSSFLGIPEFAEARFATADGRMENWEEHQRLLGPKLLERTSQEWADAAASWRLTFGLTQTTTDLLRCPQLNARAFFAGFDGGVAPAAPYLVDGERPTP